MNNSFSRAKLEMSPRRRLIGSLWATMFFALAIVSTLFPSLGSGQLTAGPDGSGLLFVGGPIDDTIEYMLWLFFALV